VCLTLKGQTRRGGGPAGKPTTSSQIKNVQYTRGVNVQQANISGRLPHTHTHIRTYTRRPLYNLFKRQTTALSFFLKQISRIPLPDDSFHQFRRIL